MTRAAGLRVPSLRARLIVLGGAVTAVVVSVTFLALRHRAIADVRRVFATELAGSQRSLRGLQERNLQLLLSTSSLVSTSPTLRAAMETARVETNAGQPARSALLATIRGEAQRVFAEQDHDLLIVTDDQGMVLVSIGRGSVAAPPSLQRLPAVRHALRSERPRADSSFGVLHIGGTAYQVGCAAILINGFPAGVLVLGDRLDRLVPQYGSMVGTDIIITEGPDVLASQPQRPPEDVRAAALVEPSTDSVPRRVVLGHAEFVAASLSLGATEDNQPVTLHILRSLSEAVGPLESALGRSFLLAGLVAVLLTALGAAAVARTTLNPLQQFVAFLESGAERGALERYRAARAPAEVEALTDSYNSLIASLARQHEELVTVNESLVEEIGNRTRAEDSLRTSEEALRQSQKLEALGTLAGGVAHDFNNLITVITGYAELLTHELPVDSPAREDIEQIDLAAAKAAALVRQLLAFSRKQVLQPRVLDLNQAVSGMEKLLRRLISADVVLETRLDRQLAAIKADPGSIEQVLMNLVVNGRDAMPDGGRLLIETANVMLDEVYQHRPEALPAGPAVMLAVRDSGAGMDAATRARIFEPFFTTKALGKGTGLGLSTVYGIVKQSGGSISVFSEPGQGAAFRIYFPPAAPDDAPVPAHDETDADAWPLGDETALVVEDEEQVRAFMQRSLEQVGYRVIAAGNGVEGLALAEAHAGTIDILLTDMVMPSMGGQELAERLRLVRPGVRVLFLSGYSAEAISRQGVLAPDSTFLAKPVSPGRLVRAVRNVLDGRPIAART